MKFLFPRPLFPTRFACAVLLGSVLAGGGMAARAQDADKPVSKTFLLDPNDHTYGWKPVKGELSYDFMSDGRLHIQGKDGEATMWEGKWTLKGDQLTLDSPTQKTRKTVTATTDGRDLYLDGKRYVRDKGE